MGHGHANALVAWTLKGNVARHWSSYAGPARVPRPL